MIYVEVMYSDLTRKRMPIKDIGQLPKDNVLFIAVLAPDPEKEGKLRRIVVSFSKDHYALCVRKWNNVAWVLLFGWDDHDFVWRRTVNPWEPQSRLQSEPPLGCMHTIFNGLAVSPEVWQEAQGLIATEVV